MCISSDVPKREALFTTGMLLMAMAELARFIVQRQHVSSDVGDAFTGLLFGLAIGLLLVAVYRRSRRRCE